MAASAGPMEKSASRTGGKRDEVPGTEVGSVRMDEQLTSEVGVTGIIGSSTIRGVGVKFASGVAAQALKRKKLKIDKKIINRIRFIYF
jgi:hypothetical protein